MAVDKNARATVQQGVSSGATGLPASLKAGIERMSGMSLDHVKVHYNSPMPAALNAHAYAQGSDIYLGPGQQRHLAHEAWHLVQQRNGRVGDNVRTHIGLSQDEDALARDAQLRAMRTPVQV